MKNIEKLRPLTKKIMADFLTPVSVFTIFKGNKYSYLLESVEKGKMGRYSFVGLSPGKVYKLFGDKVKVFTAGKTGRLTAEKVIRTADPLKFIEEVQKEYRMKHAPGLPPFCGGLVGYTNYEIIRTWEDINFKNRTDPELPAGIFMFSDEIIVFDHLHNTAEIIKLVDAGSSAASAAVKKAGRRIDEIIKMLARPPVMTGSFPLKGDNKIKITSNFTKKDFMERVKNIKKDIYNGEIIQGVFSQRLETASSVDPFNYYRALRIINPSPYMFYLKLDDIVLCGSSPEVLVRVTGDRILVRPIAGTRPRAAAEQEEKKLAQELKNDTKERAEHIMLVDLGRNDVGRVSRHGSVKVTNLMSIENYSHVMHMVTDVTGELKAGMSNMDVFKACFPAGTVSGAPKIRAIEIIEREENISRGPYAGAVGYFSFTGDMDMCIAIRTMIVYRNRVYVQAGAGIVADSVPEKEYYETLNKAKALLEAVRFGERIGRKV
ncbi:MAG: anthranilate synthase component I [Elusimicrobia bacterium]|nr:anthranilate synthase component I [Elusimicrobiota bacterium]